MRARKICSVGECGNDSFCRGYCHTHYQRWRKTGSAFTPTRTRSRSSDIYDFFHTTIAEFDGDECLTWPFARTPDGYCVMRLNGKTGIVSKFVCEKFYGKPSSKELQAAHSCGNGHLGCVNRKHLSWKTPAENTKDRITSGKRLTGNSCVAKLSPDDVAAVRAMRGTVPIPAIAKSFGVVPSTISKIFSGKAWTTVHQKS